MSLPSVPVRKLGSQGLHASAQGLGCMGMSFGLKSVIDHAGDEKSIQTINWAIEHGVTFLDTSDVYGPFTNEELVGHAIKGKRNKVVIATKCGIILKDGHMIYDGSRQHVREACEASLKRLGVDQIDLYYLHRVDPNTPVSETFQEFKNLELVHAVKALAARKGCTPGKLALAWVHAQGEDVFPIPGTKRVKYLEENVGALGLQLTPQDLQEMEQAVPMDKVVGDRFADMKKLSYHYRTLAAAQPPASA